MIDFVESNTTDLSRIQAWTRADAWHKRQDKPSWWLTGQGFLSFLVKDDEGPLVYVRVNHEPISETGSWYRVHCQFAPREEASRERIITALDEGLQKLTTVLRTVGVEGVRFDSENPSLVRFLRAYGFEKDESKGDYFCRFQGVN